eukprot:9650638-Ditylum_brightwellii.AAC.1
MPELESAKNHDMSCTELSIEDRWKGCTMQYINNVKKDAFGGHWQITCGMYKGGIYYTRRYFRIDEFYEECIKNPKCLELFKEYVAKNKDVQHIYEHNVTSVLLKTTDIHEVPSNHISKSKETTSDMM